MRWALGWVWRSAPGAVGPPRVPAGLQRPRLLLHRARQLHRTLRDAAADRRPAAASGLRTAARPVAGAAPDLQRRSAAAPRCSRPARTVVLLPPRHTGWSPARTR